MPVPSVAERGVPTPKPPFPAVFSKEAEPRDPEEIFARLINFCHKETVMLAYLSLTDSPQTSYDIAKALLPDASLEEHTKRARLIKAHLDKNIVSIAGFATSEIDTKRVPGKGVSLYTLTPLGKTMQGVVFNLLTGLADMEQNDGTKLSLSHILSKIALGRRNVDRREEKAPATRRSPYRRAKILEMLRELPRKETTTFIRLAEKVGIDGDVVSRHAHALRQARLVHFTSIDPEQSGYFIYVPIPGRELPESLNLQKTHTSSQIASLFLVHAREALRTNPNITFNTHTLTEQLYEQYASTQNTLGQNPLQKHEFSHNISRLLSLLKREGYFTGGAYVIGEGNSRVRLTPLGRKVAAIISEAKKACGDSALAENMYRKFQYAFPAFLERDAPILLAKEGRLRQTPARRKNHIIRFLAAHHQGKRRGEIDEALERDAGALLTELAAEDILTKKWSLAQGRPGRSQRGPASIYKLTERARKILELNPDTPYEKLRAT